MYTNTQKSFRDMTQKDVLEFLERTGRNPDGSWKRKPRTRATPLPCAAPDAALTAAMAEQDAKPPKYFNQKVYVYADGTAQMQKSDIHGKLVEKFDSIKECRRCQELRLMERAGKISELELQKPLVIQPEITRQDGEKLKAIVYRADFAYMENGVTVIEDVKGFDKKSGKYRTTQAFKLKWKLLKALYPDFAFRLY